MEPLSSRDTLEHAWRYFGLHAGQRMSLFNYFLVSFAFVSAGLAGCIRASGLLLLVGVGLGLALAALAFAFWKLDQRSAFLVKHAESALRELEASVVPDAVRLFDSEPAQTQGSESLPPSVSRLWTYGKTFRFLFLVAGLVGLAGALLSLALFLG